MNTHTQRPVPEKSQIYYGKTVHWLTIAACLIVLIAPVYILLFPQKNLLNPNLVFGAIFEGQKPAEIWAAAGVSFKPGDFWELFRDNIFAPDGFAGLGVTLGCSVTLWALMPAIWVFIKQKDWLYTCISVFIMALIGLAMSGLINMAG